jgi:type I restriction enzyme S subunit
MYGQGKTRGQIAELKIEAATNQACAGIEIYTSNSELKEYIKLFFIKNYDEIRKLASGGAQPNLNLTKVKSTVIPFPCFEEQKQIVRKVDELMSLCNNLEAKIKLQKVEQEKLVGAVIANLK